MSSPSSSGSKGLFDTSIAVKIVEVAKKYLPGEVWLSYPGPLGAD